MKERIRAIMESKGMTQQEFSQFLEMSPASLSSIFTGRTNPTLNVVESIKKKFDNINLEWLMFGNGQMFIEDETVDANESTAIGDGSCLLDGESSNQNYVSPELQYKNSDANDPYRSTSNRDIPRNNQSGVNSSVITDVKIIDKRVRKIKEIRVFYDDQTYESFVPKE